MDRKLEPAHLGGTGISVSITVWKRKIGREAGFIVMLKTFYGEILIGCGVVIAVLGAVSSAAADWRVGTAMLAIAVCSLAGLLATLRQRLAQVAHSGASGDSESTSGRLAADLTRREQELSDRLLLFQEGMEFPVAETIQQPDRPREAWSQESERDRRLFALLETESQDLFEKIRNNQYTREGRVQVDLIRDEALRLVKSVAAIYRPDLEEPLLETSCEKVLRAASRICLQLLVVIDQLPLDIKSYNLRRLHGTVQQAVKAYGMYRSVEPYWPYLNRVYYLGRFALGASPVSLGAWWVASSLGARGAKEVASQVVNQQAMRLLQELVRVIGFEVATLYSEDFRYRDSNWVYGSLLTDLFAKRELDSVTLTEVLSELSNLPLRSEHDRVFLFRCIASHRAAPTGSVPLSRILEPSDRRAICRRLHAFLQKLSLENVQPLSEWTQHVESWLDVRWPTTAASSKDDKDQVLAGLRSLLGFLLEFKSREVKDAVDHLPTTRLFRRLDDAAQQGLCDELSTEPPFFFEQPMLDIDSQLANEYCDDLIELSVGCQPYDSAEEDLFRQVAAYLHIDENVITAKLNQESVQRLARRQMNLDLSSPPPGEIARAIMDIVPEVGAVTGIYSGVTAESETGKIARDLWLVATASKLFALRQLPVAVVWMSDEGTELELTTAWSGNYATLKGGQWTISPEGDSPRLIVTAGLLQRNDSFFKPLRVCIAD